MHSIEFIPIANEMHTQINLIHAEIEFWREMIERKENAHAGRAVDRMRMALALAERKLLKLETEAFEPDFGPGAGTNLFLEEWSRH